MSSIEQNAALAKIANGRNVIPAGRAKFRIGNFIVHVRFCSLNRKSPGKGKFAFNINPNTMRANFELWVCGSASIYYLIPIAVIQRIYENPTSYVDGVHPEIRIVTVDTNSHTVTYAKGGEYLRIQSYRQTLLPSQGMTDR